MYFEMNSGDTVASVKSVMAIVAIQIKSVNSFVLTLSRLL